MESDGEFGVDVMYAIKAKWSAGKFNFPKRTLITISHALAALKNKMFPCTVAF